jgi:hypothetical protein
LRGTKQSAVVLPKFDTKELYTKVIITVWACHQKTKNAISKPFKAFLVFCCRAIGFTPRTSFLGLWGIAFIPHARPPLPKIYYLN